MRGPIFHFKHTPPDQPTSQRWRLDALCAEVGDDVIWFPEKGGSTREAKAVCARCTVREACLEDALAWDERFGIRAGLSERQRRAIAQQRKREARPVTTPRGEVAA